MMLIICIYETNNCKTRWWSEAEGYTRDRRYDPSIVVWETNSIFTIYLKRHFVISQLLSNI